MVVLVGHIGDFVIHIGTDSYDLYWGFYGFEDSPKINYGVLYFI